jgi:aminoacrylate hydrolase
MAQFQRPGFSQHYEVVDGVFDQDTLFLHGNLAANLWWEPALEIAKKQRPGKGRAVLAEWRGCGGSREFQGGLNLATLGADCNALLEHLGLGPVNLVGHSTGGLIGLHALAQAPERYAKAVLLDTVAPDGVQFGPEMRDAFQQMSRDRDFCATVILGTIQGGGLTETFRQRIADAAFNVAPEIWAGVPRMLQSPPPLDLASLSHPVLVLHGELDQVLPLEKSEQLSRNLGQGRFHKLSGRGHCCNVEDPGLFVELMGSFFSA